MASATSWAGMCLCLHATVARHIIFLEWLNAHLLVLCRKARGGGRRRRRRRRAAHDSAPVLMTKATAGLGWKDRLSRRVSIEVLARARGCVDACNLAASPSIRRVGNPAALSLCQLRV